MKFKLFLFTIASAFLLSAFPIAASAQDALTDFTSVPQQANQPFQAAPEPTPLAGVTIYTDRPTFEAAFPDLDKEDFEEANVGAGGITACSDGPIDNTTNDACFSPGDITSGLSFSRINLGGFSPALVALGPGYSGNPSKYLSSNYFIDAFAIDFSGGDDTVAGFDLHCQLGNSATTDVDVYGTGGLITSTVVNCTNAGAFFGVDAGEVITRIEILDNAGNAEGVDNLCFGAPGIVANDDDYDTDEDTLKSVPAPGVLSNDVAYVNPMTNGGFEMGDLTGWGTVIPAGGSATVVTSQLNNGECDSADFTYLPVEGSYFLAMKTNGPGSETWATQDFNADAGATIMGSAAFDNGDYDPFNDYARVEILDDGGFVIATPWEVNGLDVPDFDNGAWTEWSWVAPATGIYTVRLLVSNDGDGVCDSLAHFDDIVLEAPPLTAVLDDDVSHGVLILNADGSFTYDPDENYCGPDSFTYHATDGLRDSNIATVDITVNCVNDLPEVTIVAPALQTADYSDFIGTVTITVEDVDDDSTTLAESNEPPDSVISLSLALTGCTPIITDSPDEDGSTCTFDYDGQVLDPADTSPGDHSFDILFTPSDADGAGTVTGTHALTITPESATVTLDGDNDVAIEVPEPDEDSGEFSLFFSAIETVPDFANIGSPEYGDLNFMVPYMTLIPIGPGAPVDGICDFILPLPDYPTEEYGQVAMFQCDFDEVPVNAYEVIAEVWGVDETAVYYQGFDDAVLVIYDPSLGFTTGGGWFYWPGTADPELTTCGEDGYAGDKTNFGFNMKYNKKMTNVQGSLLLQRHTVDANCEGAGKFRVKSNKLDGLSVGNASDGDDDYGWAAFGGKSVFNVPGLEGEGNHPFLAYVEDHDDQGCNQDPTDEFWIQVKDKDGNVVLEVNYDPDNPPNPAGDDGADGDDAPIECGNIIVPHKTKGKK